MGDMEKAKTCFLQALAEYELGNFPSAEALLRQALEIAPDRVSVLTNLSAVLLRLNRPSEARLYAEKSIELEPDNVEGWLNKGNSLNALGLLNDALACYDRAIALNPDCAEAWMSRGNTQESLRLYAEALISYDRAVAIKPAYSEAWFNRGNTLNSLQRPGDAVVSLDRAIAQNPRYPEAWYNRGNTLITLARYEEALYSFDQSILLRPEHAESISNRGSALVYLKRYQDALDSYDRAIALDPEFAHPHCNRGICKLLLGDFEQGWSDYAWRWGFGKHGDKPAFEMPEWNGKRVDGSLLAWGEQGLGDQILHMGMLDQLMLVSNQVVLAVEPRLVSLAQRSFPGINVARITAPLPEQEYCAWIPLGDLGRHFRKSWLYFPTDRTSYLKPDHELAERLRRRLTQKHNFVCGVSWISKNSEFGTHKSLRLIDMLDIFGIPGIEFVDLQYGDTRQEREEIAREHGVRLTRLDDIDNTKDIDGLAALINACDMVVTISNTTAHLAGAVGKETLLMLPYSQGRLWYWHENRDDSPWYPSVRIFRQTRPHVWEEVLSRVAQEVRRRVANKTA